MFNIFKRDPAREKLKIPGRLFTITFAGAANACNILRGSVVKLNFGRDAIFGEVCAYHVRVTIGTMMRSYNECETYEFEKHCEFLQGQQRVVIERANDPQVVQTLNSQGFEAEDLERMKRLMFSDKTFELAACYFMKIGLDVSEEDVLDYARKHNPKILSLSSEDRDNSIYKYIVRCVRLSGLEGLPNKDYAESCLVRFNDSLMQSGIEMEKATEELVKP